jgi:peroxiredoxin Q/BCP
MYGAWKEKNLYGRRTWGVARMTYWIDPDGRVKKVYKKIDTERHGQDILEDLKAAKA